MLSIENPMFKTSIYSSIHSISADNKRESEVELLNMNVSIIAIKIKKRMFKSPKINYLKIIYDN